MPVIRPYVAEHEPAVVAFNRRLNAGGCTFALRPRAPAPDETGWHGFVAVEVDEESGAPMVRGGYIGVRHPFSVCGEDVEVHHLKLPLSESAIDPRYNAVGVQLLLDAQRRYPLSFVLGMGGRHGPLPRMLESLGWRLIDVPFFVRVARPSQFLRQVSILRTTAARRIALDLLAASGVGACILPVHAWLGRHASRLPDGTATLLEDWGDDSFVDDIWRKGRSQVAFASRRDAVRLGQLYPASDRRFIRLRVDRNGQSIGWALILDSQLAGHAQLGNMRLGSLVDGFALPGEELLVVRAATRVLADRGVDLMVSNQSARAWCDAMRSNGWIERPSNYVLALSKQLAARVPVDAPIHVTRGDGDGPIHL